MGATSSPLFNVQLGHRQSCKTKSSAETLGVRCPPWSKFGEHDVPPCGEWRCWWPGNHGRYAGFYAGFPAVSNHESAAQKMENFPLFAQCCTALLLLYYVWTPSLATTVSICCIESCRHYVTWRAASRILCGWGVKRRGTTRDLSTKALLPPCLAGWERRTCPCGRGGVTPQYWVGDIQHGRDDNTVGGITDQTSVWALTRLWEERTGNLFSSLIHSYKELSKLEMFNRTQHRTASAFNSFFSAFPKTGRIHICVALTRSRCGPGATQWGDAWRARCGQGFRGTKVLSPEGTITIAFLYVCCFHKRNCLRGSEFAWLSLKLRMMTT